ncbi:MAG: flippase-like domain-containing protein [Thermoleophilia bacterium]|nr:flippase-like domain-containing protein [Thermoleophilia bacterium]
MNRHEGISNGGRSGRLKRILGSRPFRAAVSAGLLAALFLKLGFSGDLAQTGQTLIQVQGDLLALGIFVFLVTNMVSVSKWLLIVRAQGQTVMGRPVSYLYLTSLFYIGLFFNNLMLTSVGGDVVRAFKLSRASSRPPEAAGSVFLDRVSSTVALLVLAMIAMLWGLKDLPVQYAFMILGMFIVSLAMVAFFASERAARRLGRFPLLRMDPLGLRRHLRSFYFSLNEFKRLPRTLAVVLAVSFTYQILHILTVYVLALALGITIPVMYYFLFIPVVLAVSMLPISIGGFGVRESAWVVLFSQVGVGAGQALSMSLLSVMVMTAVSLAGGVFYLFDRAVPAPEGETGNG